MLFLNFFIYILGDFSFNFLNSGSWDVWVFVGIFMCIMEFLKLLLDVIFVLNVIKFRRFKLYRV